MEPPIRLSRILPKKPSIPTTATVMNRITVNNCGQLISIISVLPGLILPCWQTSHLNTDFSQKQILFPWLQTLTPQPSGEQFIEFMLLRV